MTALGAAIVGPGIPGIVEEFNVSEEVAILPLSLYTLGLAFGPLIAAPCCETFGRKIVFVVSSPLYALFTLGAGFSPSIGSLVACRFFAGLFAAPAIGNASATIIDYTAGKARGVTMAFYYSVPQLGAVFGPLGKPEPGSRASDILIEEQLAASSSSRAVGDGRSGPSSSSLSPSTSLSSLRGKPTRSSSFSGVRRSSESPAHQYQSRRLSSFCEASPEHS